ncbi:NTP transferase domain-containing protein [Pseudoalteromonas piscicida]|uniref:nucleotidyltransferase family protein n=1 Tax=Pseudoalteromonas TaxID=53246 RepID=UPI0015746E07|nr:MULTISPECIES: NTP transferase domain-containing protein [Pseudoalteromonas]UDM60524.1 NTP transferase domain-containing protein [Pseudoalteromonas piscicida]
MIGIEQPPKLIILAGGLGSRFGGNKQVAELPSIDKSIMELSIIDAHHAGVQDVILIINDKVRSLIENVILPRLPKALNITLVQQRLSDIPNEFIDCLAGREKPWGTGHALLCAKPYVDKPAIVITADDYYGPDAFEQLVEHFQHHSNMAMVAYPIINTLSDQGGVNRGVCQVQAQQLHSVEEALDIRFENGELSGDIAGKRCKIASSALASMTCWGVTPSLFDSLEAGFNAFLRNYDNGVKKEYYLPDCIQHSINKGRQTVSVYQAKSHWYGITYKSELDIVARKIYEARQGR